MHIDDIDTPFAAIDLDVVENNIRVTQHYCDQHGIKNRPHIKTHKLPAIAHMQLRAGAVGITCQKLGEAEVMEAAGLDDILLSFPLVGTAKAERLAALASEAKVAVAADSAEVARGLSPALGAAGVEVGFLVELDGIFKRTGVQTPEEAADVAETVALLPGLRFDGLMAYPTTPETGPAARSAIAAIESRGLEVRTVSSGGTPTFFTNHEVPEITEVRAGTYIYGDRTCIANGTVLLGDCALRIRATVVSRPTADRAILDCGSKTLTNDAVEDPTGGSGHGLVVEYPDARLHTLHEEHGFLDLSECAERPQIGDVVSIVPNHACACTNLHDEVAAHRSGRVVGFWPVAARGKLR